MAEHNFDELADELSDFSQAIEAELIAMNRIPTCYMVPDDKGELLYALIQLCKFLANQGVRRIALTNRMEGAAHIWREQFHSAN